MRTEHNFFTKKKKILSLCLRWHISGSYRFVAEVTFKGNLQLPYRILRNADLEPANTKSLDLHAMISLILLPFTHTIHWSRFYSFQGLIGLSNLKSPKSSGKTRDLGIPRSPNTVKYRDLCIGFTVAEISVIFENRTSYRVLTVVKLFSCTFNKLSCINCRLFTCL